MHSWHLQLNSQFSHSVSDKAVDTNHRVKSCQQRRRDGRPDSRDQMALGSWQMVTRARPTPSWPECGMADPVVRPAEHARQAPWRQRLALGSEWACPNKCWFRLSGPGKERSKRQRFAHSVRRCAKCCASSIFLARSAAVSPATVRALTSYSRMGAGGKRQAPRQ